MIERLGVLIATVLIAACGGKAAVPQAGDLYDASAGAGGSANTGGATTETGGAPSGDAGGTSVVDAGSSVICPGAAVPPAVGRWVDDFEGTGAVLQPLLRWITMTDGHELITAGSPAEGGIVEFEPLGAWGSHDPASKYGLHIQAVNAVPPEAGENLWGAMWDFESDWDASRTTVNVSSYTGMLFWARLGNVSARGDILVQFPTIQTVPRVNGGDGTCEDGVKNTCFINYQAEVRVTQTCWTPLEVPFKKVNVIVAPAPAGGFDKTHVLGVNLLVSAWGTLLDANWPVDVIVDDIYLY